ncbi:MAG TPA: hypothetical protein VGJ78_13465 [Vicinamibacterales bacterium]
MVVAVTTALAWQGVAAAQAQGADARARSQGTLAAKTIPRTPWGAPDLGGLWNTNTLVPVERNPQYGMRALMTEEEHAKALADLQQRNQRPGRDSREVGGKSGVGTEKDVARAYNEFWFGDKPTKLSYRTSMIVDPANGRMPPYTPEAAKRIADKRDFLAALLQGTSGGRPGPISPRRKEPSPDYNLDRVNRADGPEDRGGPERCFGDNLPVTMGTGTFGGVMQVVQAPDSVSIYYDVGQGQGFAWVIPITNRPHLPKNIQLYRGDAIGHWEGDTLAVDVTNFSDETNFRGSRQNLHLIQRFRRLDANTLQMEFTAEDATTWTRPWTAVQELERADDKTTVVLEGGCHEGNYGLLGMLLNTRAAEKAFAEGKGPDPATQDNATGGGDN